MKSYKYYIQRSYLWHMPSWESYDTFTEALLASMEWALREQSKYPEDEVEIIIYERDCLWVEKCVYHENVNNTLKRINLNELYNPEIL